VIPLIQGLKGFYIYFNLNINLYKNLLKDWINVEVWHQKRRIDGNHCNSGSEEHSFCLTLMATSLMDYKKPVVYISTDLSFSSSDYRLLRIDFQFFETKRGKRFGEIKVLMC